MDRRLTLLLLCGGLGLASGSCSDRELEDEPIEIERLCHEYCARVMECVWYPGANADFDTAEGCEHNCRTQQVWRTTCDQIRGELLECYVGYDCPEFSDLGTDYPGGMCSDEIDAWNICQPGEPR